jgi:hypothetical protein
VKNNLTPIYIGVGAGVGGFLALGAAVFAVVGYKRYQRKKRFIFVVIIYST